MYGLPIPPPPETGRYALTVTVAQTAIHSDDLPDLTTIGDRMRGAEVRVKLIDGREFVVGKVDVTRVAPA
jgi:hypothetical protein